MKLSRDESRAVAFVLGLIALAALARVVARPHENDLASGAEIDAAALEVRSETALAREKASTRPLGKDERIDVNGASAEELDRLPGVGPALAAKIVAERERGGAYDSAADLRMVPGFGRVLLGRLEPHLAFGPGPGLVPRQHAIGGAGRETVAEQPESRQGRRSGRSTAKPEERPGAPSPRPPIAQSAPLDLNRATAAELEALPGIGPALAARIVACRDSLRGFRSVEELVKVRGIGPATLARLRAFFRT